MDPLELLPAEIVLRIFDFCPISILAVLTRLSRSWHSFIDEAHQAAIYSSPSKTDCPYGHRDLLLFNKSQSFVKYFEGTQSWKELCKRQTLLHRNWNSEEPITRESIIQVDNDAVWRFRVDWKRRFIISTSQQGGLNVTDLDTGSLLWRLSNNEVRPFAHLEYQDGVAVFDCAGNGLEVWNTDRPDLPRGAFEQITVIPHDCTVRGFQFAHNTLCVVSNEGQAFVYDMTTDAPQLRTRLGIEKDATGHLSQDEEVVMYCMGKKGYHIHDKQSGALVGVLDPARCNTFYHIVHPDEPRYSIVSTGNSFSSLPSVEVFPPKEPTRERLSPISLHDGPFEGSLGRSGGQRIQLNNDEWGAGILSGSKMVGISSGGRMFVCADWKTALSQPKSLETISFLIECDAKGSSYHANFGGWLSVRDGRALFEIRDRVYVISLDWNKSDSSRLVRPSYCFTTSSATQLAVPVSFMAIYDDCIMSTYTTLGWRRRVETGNPAFEADRSRFRIFPTKTIRILSLAPSLNLDNDEIQSPVSAATSQDTHANILEIMEMLSDTEDDDMDDDSLAVNPEVGQEPNDA